MAVSDYVLKDREGLIKAGKQITVSTMQNLVFKPFMGKDDQSIIKTSSEFPTETTIAKIRLRGRLAGAGAANNTDVSSNRDTMTNLYQNVEYEHFSNSVKSDDKTPIRNKAAASSFREDSKAELTEWANARLTNIMFARLSENCTNIVACKSDGVYAGAVNACSSIPAGGILTTLSIAEAVKRAKIGYDGNGAKHPKIRPFMLKPDNATGINQTLSYYLMMVDGYAAEQLKKDPLWLDAQKHAQNRGLMNNVFTGALGIYNGVVIYETKNRDDEENYAGVHTSAMGNYYHYTSTAFDMYKGVSSRETSINLLLGATAGLLPMQEAGMDYWEGDDNENEKMICRTSWGVSFRKAKFQGLSVKEQASVYHNKDYGVIAVVSSKE